MAPLMPAGFIPGSVAVNIASLITWSDREVSKPVLQSGNWGVHIKILRKLSSRTKQEWKKVKLRQDDIFLRSLNQRFLEHSESNNHVISWAFLTHIYSMLPSDLLACFPKQPVLTYGLHCLPGQGMWRKHFHVIDGGFWVISKAWPKPSAFFVISQGAKLPETNLLKKTIWNFFRFNLIG